MNQATITVIVNNNTYSLSTSTSEAIRSMPDADRQQLIAVLELLKQQPGVAQSPVSQTTTEISRTVYSTGESVSTQASHSERLGRGDIDTLAAQLMMEEKARQKPGLTKQTIYKWVFGVAAVVIFLLSIF